MKFLGYEVNGHLVAASSPATETVEKIMKCEENGAIAAILKSASSSRLNDGKMRRCYWDDKRKEFWAESGFDREILPLKEAVKIAKEAVQKSEILIIPSVTELSLDKECWLESCKAFESVGAHAIQLDFFYFSELMSQNNFNERFVDLLSTLVKQCNIPIVPKLSINLPADFTANLLKKAGVKYVSLLDSVRSPKPVEADLRGESLSVFGSWMLPLTRQYTKIFVENGFEVCAGGGVTDAFSASELIRLGASTVQIATEVLINGFERFVQIEEKLHIENEEKKYSGKQYVEFDPDKCVGCGKCFTQTFCDIVHDLDNLQDKCEGCGLCADLCEYQALEMKKTL